MPTSRWLKTTSFLSCSCSVLFWVAWELSHHPFSRTHADGIATAGNIVADGNKEVVNYLRLLKLPIPPVLTVLWPKRVIWSHPSSRIWRSAVTPHAKAKKWEYVVDGDNGYDYIRFWSQSILFALLTHSLPKRVDSQVQSIPCSQLESQDCWGI